MNIPAAEQRGISVCLIFTRPKGRGIRPDPSSCSGSVRLNNFASQNYSLTDLKLRIQQHKENTL